MDQQPLATVAPASSTKGSPIIVTRFMLYQALNGFCSTRSEACQLRQRIGGCRGARPRTAGMDHKMRHPDRELFDATCVATMFFPNDGERREAFLRINFGSYAHEVDRTAIKHAPDGAFD